MDAGGLWFISVNQPLSGEKIVLADGLGRDERELVDGLRFLREFSPAGEVLERLRRTDPCMELRQCAVIDSSGRTACWSRRLPRPMRHRRCG